MTNTEIKRLPSETLQIIRANLQTQMEEFAPLEERLEQCFQKAEAFRQRLLISRCSYDLIHDYDEAIQPIVQQHNELEYNRQMLQKLETELQARAQNNASQQPVYQQ